MLNQFENPANPKVCSWFIFASNLIDTIVWKEGEKKNTIAN
jgi:hypothetical protein